MADFLQNARNRKVAERRRAEGCRMWHVTSSMYGYFVFHYDYGFSEASFDTREEATEYATSLYEKES